MQGFVMVAAIMAVGYVLGRRGTLGPGGPQALNAFVFHAALPALLLDKITTSHPGELFNAQSAQVVVSALAAGAVSLALARLLLRRPWAESVVMMLAGSYCNAAYLGLPLAAYVLGDATVVIPVVLFQVGFYGPVAVAALEIAATRRAAAPQPASSRRGRVLAVVAAPARNPVVLAAAAGLVIAFSPLTVPEMVARPVHVLGEATIPVALAVFGMSLAASRPFGAQTQWADLVLAVVVKNFVHPLIAGLCAYFVWGFSGAPLQAAIVLGALPTAQNVFIYALRYRIHHVVVRDCALLSTVVSLPVLLLIAALI